MPKNIHDKVFMDLLSDQLFIESLLKNYLPREISDRIHWNIISLSTLDPRHLNAKTKRLFIADNIYLATINSEGDLLCFHFEHQSKPDRSLPLRITNYASAALINYIKLCHGNKKVPPIISFIYYQGIKPYPFDVSLKNIFIDSELGVKYFGKPILIDLANIPDDQLRSHAVIGQVELILKHIRRKDFSKNYRDFIKELQLSDDRIREIMLRYITERTDIPIESFVDAVLEFMPQDKEIAMTVAEQLRQQGREQGLQLGMQQGMEQGMRRALIDTAKKMLARGIDLTFVHECTGLSFEVLEKITAEKL